MNVKTKWENAGAEWMKENMQEFEKDPIKQFHVAIMMPFQIPSKSIGSHNAWQQS